VGNFHFEFFLNLKWILFLGVNNPQPIVKLWRGKKTICYFALYQMNMVLFKNCFDIFLKIHFLKEMLLTVCIKGWTVFEEWMVLSLRKNRFFSLIFFSFCAFLFFFDHLCVVVVLKKVAIFFFAIHFESFSFFSFMQMYFSFHKKKLKKERKFIFFLFLIQRNVLFFNLFPKKLKFSF